VILLGNGPSPPEPLSKSVTIALTATDKERLAAAAKKKRTTQSALCREAVLKALGGA
jgi:predicted DNA-binding protein